MHAAGPEYEMARSPNLVRSLCNFPERKRVVLLLRWVTEMQQNF